MLMYPKEYNEFSQLVKQQVVLNVMLKVLEHDKKVIINSNCKLNKSYEEILSEIQWRIERDIVKNKRTLKELGGAIIEEEQQSSVRIVKAKFRGFIYTHRFLNYVLQAESEKILKTYIIQEQKI